jgi:hypothetical protein
MVGSLPVGGAGAGAVGAARRAAADVVHNALNMAGLSPANGNSGGGRAGGSMPTPPWRSGAVTSAVGTPAAQRLIDGSGEDAPDDGGANEDGPDGDGLDPQVEGPTPGYQRLVDLMDALEMRILAQIERRGGRYRGMFS